MDLQKSPNQQSGLMVSGAVENRLANLSAPGYCRPCGVKVRVGIFFDAFGRCALTDKTSLQYSNITKLWLAHKDMTTQARPPQEVWFKLYYPGIATKFDNDVNHQLNGRDISLLGMQFVKSVNDLKTKGEKKVDKLKPGEVLKDGVKDIKKDAKARGKALMQSVWEQRNTPITFKEIAKEEGVKLVDDAGKAAGKAAKSARRYIGIAKTISEYGVRGATRIAETAWRKTSGAVADFCKDPKKILGATKRLVIDTAALMGVEAIPVLRDDPSAAMIAGLGFDTRFSQARDDFEELLKQVKACAEVQRIHDIEICLFGADRGATMARAFANELVHEYKKHEKLMYEDAPMTIKFMGLFDCVASLAGSGSKLFSFVPLIKSNFSEHHLEVPEEVERCVHFVAAHEQRFYQRLDSLSKTKGEEYYYPGVSEDVTGGVPQHGIDGFRDLLSRVPLQEMMMVAHSAGAAFPTLNFLKTDANIFPLFNQSHDFPTRYGGTTNVIEMVRKYREVAGTTGTGPEGRLAVHQGIFLRWLHLRYRDKAFTGPMAAVAGSDAAVLDKEQDQAKQKSRAAEHAFNIASEDMSRIPATDRNLSNPKFVAARDKTVMTHKDLVAAREEEKKFFGEATVSDNRSYLLDTLAERVDREVAALKFKRNHMGLYGAMHMITKHVPAEISREHTWLPDIITETQLTLLAAWELAESGISPLPEVVIAMFDELVHDTLMVSWPDHVFAHNLYFDGRDVDHFGKTPVKKSAPTQAPRQVLTAEPLPSA